MFILISKVYKIKYWLTTLIENPKSTNSSLSSMKIFLRELSLWEARCCCLWTKVVGYHFNKVIPYKLLLLQAEHVSITYGILAYGIQDFVTSLISSNYSMECLPYPTFDDVISSNHILLKPVERFYNETQRIIK